MLRAPYGSTLRTPQYVRDLIGDAVPKGVVVAVTGHACMYLFNVLVPYFDRDVRLNLRGDGFSNRCIPFS